MDRRRLSGKGRKASGKANRSESSIPIRRSSRLHKQPLIRDQNELMDYALDKLDIDGRLWKAAAKSLAGGDLKKLMLNMQADFPLFNLMANHPHEFKLFFERQLPYWSGNLPPPSPSLPHLDVEEEVIASSIFIFSSLSNETNSFNRLKVFSTPPPSMTLLKTLDNIPDHLWPACVTLGSFVYFIGGICMIGDDIFSSKKMFALDVAHLNNKDDQGPPPPPLLQLPNMNVGKSNPLALAVKGKIYVLSFPIRHLDKRALSNHKFYFSPNPRDWTLVDRLNHADWYYGAFEVYDPSTCEWTVLPLPTNLPPSDYRSIATLSTILHLSNTTGYAAVRDRLFFFTHYKGPVVYTFDTRTLRWNSYGGTRATPEVHDYYDSLAYQLLGNGMHGRGLVVKDTLYAFSSISMENDEDFSSNSGIWVYRLPKSPDDRLCHSGPLTGFCVSTVYGPAVSMRLQASVVFIGDGKFGCLHVKEIRQTVSYGRTFPSKKDWVAPPREFRTCFTTFNVREVEEGNDDRHCWHADSLVEYELNGFARPKERFFDCCAR